MDKYYPRKIYFSSHNVGSGFILVLYNPQEQVMKLFLNYENIEQIHDHQNPTSITNSL